MFIKLTSSGKEFIGNVNLLQRVFVTEEGKVGVVGWNNNGYFEVEETYQEVLSKIEKANCSIPNVRQQSKLLNAFLEWRLTKPHSDFQTREHDIKEFLEVFNCA